MALSVGKQLFQPPSCLYPTVPVCATCIDTDPRPSRSIWISRLDRVAEHPIRAVEPCSGCPCSRPRRSSPNRVASPRTRDEVRRVQQAIYSPAARCHLPITSSACADTCPSGIAKRAYVKRISDQLSDRFEKLRNSDGKKWEQRASSRVSGPTYCQCREQKRSSTNNRVTKPERQGALRNCSSRHLLASPPQQGRGKASPSGNMSSGSAGRDIAARVAASQTMAPAPQRSNLHPGDDLPDGYVDDDLSKSSPQRRAGVLLHPTSLPGPYGIGELGHETYVFLDWLKSTGCTIWQVLPLVPPGRKSGEDGSPYAGADANCGNTLLISLDELVKDGLLNKSDLPAPIAVDRIDYVAVAEVKDPLIAKAAKKLAYGTKGPLHDEMEKFRRNPKISVWLEEAALFAAIDHSIDAQFWWDWPEPVRDRHGPALEKARQEHKEFIDLFVAQQFLFQKQWQAVHKYANSKGIKIIGDMPIYVGGHSADVWANRAQFMLDKATGVPVLVSGVPPDAFSATGQLWGSPLYNWQVMAKDGYAWWAKRMRRAFELYDEFRIDHFRGLAGYWAIPADAETAMQGTWKLGPREDLFNAIKAAVGKIDIIAEDLGIITRDVVDLRRAIAAPGMAVLQFAFGSDSKNPHLPHNHEVDQVVYPGTHDNDTSLGWWQKASETEKENVRRYLRFEGDGNISWEFISAALSSVARTAVVPLQDVMGLDNSARMNIPAVQAGNWGWRVGESDAFQNLKDEAKKLHTLLARYNRLPRQD